MKISDIINVNGDVNVKKLMRVIDAVEANGIWDKVGTDYYKVKMAVRNNVIPGNFSGLVRSFIADVTTNATAMRLVNIECQFQR